MTGALVNAGLGEPASLFQARHQQLHLPQPQSLVNVPALLRPRPATVRVVLAPSTAVPWATGDAAHPTAAVISRRVA